MMDFGFGFGGLWMILFLALLVMVVVMLAKSSSGTRRPSSSDLESPHQTALQILEERYARGELEREEFLQKKRDLQQNTGDKSV